MLNQHLVVERLFPNKWRHNDLTANFGGPPAAGDPCGYEFRFQNNQDVFYRGTDGHIHELSGGVGAWDYNNLTAATAAPAAAGDLCGYGFDAQGNQHVFYRGTDGHIHELEAPR